MASTFNLVRNSRVWFTGAVDANGNIPTSGATVTDTGSTATRELTILDGFSFSQSTQQQTIQLSEAGVAPVRGQRAFNTTLDPVEFSFSTYMKPQGTSAIIAEEDILWNALFSANAIPTTSTPITISGITRSATNVATATIACTAVALTAIGVTAVGDIFVLSNFASTVTAVQEWTGPVKVLASPTGGFGAATSISVEYLQAPNAAATMAGSAGTATISTCAWNSQGTAVSVSPHAFVTTALSNKNQLQKFGMFFLVDNALYAIDNCVLDSATIDFGLDGIATIAWTGKGTKLRYLPTATVSSAGAAVFGGSGNITGTAKARVPGNYITNKLSTMKLLGKIGGADNSGAGTTYNIALTGGSISIANNISYVVPNNLGVVNQPIGYFTGTRSITGNVTAYLRTGTNNSAQIISDILTANAAETKFKVQIEIGGATNGVHVDMEMNGCVLQVPTVETGDVMSTTVNFSAQGYEPAYAASAGSNIYDIEQTNDLAVYYYSNATAT